MNKFESLSDSMSLEELMEVKGGDKDIVCAPNVSAVTCTGSGGVNNSD